MKDQRRPERQVQYGQSRYKKPLQREPWHPPGRIVGYVPKGAKPQQLEIPAATSIPADAPTTSLPDEGGNEKQQEESMKTAVPVLSPPISGLTRDTLLRLYSIRSDEGLIDPAFKETLDVYSRESISPEGQKEFKLPMSRSIMPPRDAMLKREESSSEPAQHFNYPGGGRGNKGLAANYERQRPRVTNAPSWFDDDIRNDLDGPSTQPGEKAFALENLATAQAALEEEKARFYAQHRTTAPENIEPIGIVQPRPQLLADSDTLDKEEKAQAHIVSKIEQELFSPGDTASLSTLKAEPIIAVNLEQVEAQMVMAAKEDEAPTQHGKGNEDRNGSMGEGESKGKAANQVNDNDQDGGENEDEHEEAPLWDAFTAEEIKQQTSFTDPSWGSKPLDNPSTLSSTPGLKPTPTLGKENEKDKEKEKERKIEQDREKKENVNLQMAKSGKEKEDMEGKSNGVLKVVKASTTHAEVPVFEKVLAEPQSTAVFPPFAPLEERARSVEAPASPIDFRKHFNDKRINPFLDPSLGIQENDKVWYYMDFQECLQGPFSSVEMYTWHKAGYFHEKLPIRCGEQKEFIALDDYVNSVMQRYSPSHAFASFIPATSNVPFSGITNDWPVQPERSYDPFGDLAAHTPLPLKIAHSEPIRPAYPTVQVQVQVQPSNWHPYYVPMVPQRETARVQLGQDYHGLQHEDLPRTPQPRSHRIEEDPAIASAQVGSEYSGGVDIEKEQYIMEDAADLKALLGIGGIQDPK